ncbi:MAG: aminoglycoside phosphotransferase family protein [Synechococcus sp. TMED20]|jgi:Ser/Thr protein kinase RdoA (MazF antagonist)|nr:MAG: aminoglycoside phosphotransferase family protein [Synechococcus sp. TMED20]RPF83743.1 MAG: aminoglycoside phosphotransferase family protein [Synechococcus sp. TMED20]
MSEALEAIADRFHPRERITEIRALGSGNVNETFLVTHEGTYKGGQNGAFVMQRLNTNVFERPDLVMRNLVALGEHVQRRLAVPPPELRGRRWEVPRVVPCRQQFHWVEHNGQFWRSISYIGAATTTDVIRGREHAREVGYGLGMFHSLISDLPANNLADTLENFHVTPTYLDRYDQVLSMQAPDPGDALLNQACGFIETRRLGIDILESALARGELQHRPIHGDPKINNVMIDESTGQAVGLIDLDTVKPGLIHYDIGDCLRSCCNPAGEEADNPEDAHFDLSLCEAILAGYLSVARGFLSDWDLLYLPDCIRLIPLELGLRFLTDHLEGDVYFHTDDPGHNLRRAAVQFQLTKSIEAQLPAIRSLVDDLTKSEAGHP